MKIADRARRACQELSQGGKKPVTRQDLGDRLGIQTRQDMRRVDNALKALVKSGDLAPLGGGNYQWTGQTQQLTKQEIMWRYLRARRVVTAEELQEVAAASAAYVQEWLRQLIKQGLARRDGDKCRLIQDQGPEPPRNESKQDYLKRRRQRLKAALATLDAAFAAIAEARAAVSQLEE